MERFWYILYSLKKDLFRTKTHQSILTNSGTQTSQNGISPQNIEQSSQKPELRRILTAPDAIGIGLGQIIGAGIFVLSGVVAHDKAGPGVVLSYLLSGIACIFSALVYSEFATRVPISGSAYTYAYAVSGEFIAWIVGWDLTLEYTLAAATVSKGWSGYFYTFFNGVGVNIPKGLSSLNVGFTSLDFLAVIIIIIITSLLVIGVRESARINLFLMVITSLIILMLVISGSFYADKANWNDFLPFGMSGVFSGASIVFFSYIGFDGVTTVAEELKNPKRDLPIGVLASLFFSIILYCSVCTILTLMVPYQEIDTSSPLASAFATHNLKSIQVIISIAAFAALTTTIITSLLCQSRIYMSMARDGLLFPWIAKINHRFQTPANATIVSGCLACILAFFFSLDALAEMVAIGTLSAFTIVCCSILFLRYEQPCGFWKKYLPLPSLIFLIVLFSLATSFCIVYQGPIALSVILGVIALGFSASLIFFPKAPVIENAFRTPLVPFVPLLGIYCNIFMAINLDGWTFLRFLIWLIIGLIIYFSYSRKHSFLNGQTIEESSLRVVEMQSQLEEQEKQGEQVKLEDQKDIERSKTEDSIESLENIPLDD